MRVHRSPSGKPTFRRPGLWAAALSLLLASGAQAAQHFLDFNPCKNSSPDCNAGDPCVEINATTGVMLNDTIEPTDHGGGAVTFSFDITPAGCAGAGQVFTCNGVTIDATSNPVTVSGNPTAGGAFSFALSANNGMTTCFEGFELIIKESFDVVFVLDRSGSMGGSSKVTPPATDRWDALKTGVNNFTPMITSAAGAGSRFGLTLFASSVLTNNSFPGGLTAIGANLANDVNTELGSQSPSGATAMGPGLKNGMGKMTDAARPRVVVLFTDGEQNVPPEVNLDGCTFSDATTVNPTCPAGAGTVKIVTVGIGSPEGNYLTTLQQLAHQNRGKVIITGNGADFISPPGDCMGDPTAAFGCAIAPALSGSSPQVVASASGTLAGTVTLPFELDRSLEQLLIQISVNRKFERQQLLQILAGVRVTQNGSDVTSMFQPVIVGNFTNSMLLRGVFKGKSEGSYTVDMKAPAGISPALEYRTTAFADDHRLDLDWRVNPTTPRAGEPFEPTVSLTWLSRPVTDAAVEAIILKPGDDLGDLLAKDPRTVRLQEGPEAGSPGLQKYLELLKDPNFLKSLLPVEQRLTLKHQGKGIYSAPYDPGDVSGVYQVLYEVKADDPAFGTVQRQAAQSIYVRFGKIDLAASNVNTTVGNGTVTINFRPVTSTGRFVGPANASTISVTGDVRVRQITDHQDGRYTILLDGKPETEVSIKMLGDEIYRGPVGKFGASTGSLVPGTTRTSGTDRCLRWVRGLRWLCRLFSH
jgi:von Willebrand factor type A domain-containing protein